MTAVTFLDMSVSVWQSVADSCSHDNETQCSVIIRDFFFVISWTTTSFLRRALMKLISYVGMQVYNELGKTGKEVFYILLCRSQWPRGLRRRSAAARLLRSWVWIPPGAWIFVCCERRVLSGRGLCDELIIRPEESYWMRCVVVCDLETSRIRRPWPALGRSATAKKVVYFNVNFNVLKQIYCALVGVIKRQERKYFLYQDSLNILAFCAGKS